MTRNGDGEITDAEMQATVDFLNQQKEVYRCAGELLDFVAIKHDIKEIDNFFCQYMRNLAKAMKWTRE